ncbi:MAG TPA: MFS transporter [Kofleriaceae bacterium]|nr:MFS transporter [Kofleriaceae bacterium]
MHDNAFEKLDEEPLSRFHLLAMLTTGMGVFTDGYDLSSIGLVLPLVLTSFGIDRISGIESGFLTGAALVGSTIGALLFGALAQRGRKRFYGVDVGLMAAAAFAQAFAPGLWSLIAIRFVLGIGVGADYVLSPTIMAEHANRRDRGKKIGFGFSMMWGLGAIAAALVLYAVRGLGLSPDLQWRIVLGLGALPALSVLGLRRRMPETARYLARVGGQAAEARQVIAEITGAEVDRAPLADRRAWHEVLSRHARAVLGATFLWFLYDVVIYASILFGPSVIAQRIGMSEDGFSLATYGLFYVPGTALGCLLVDRLGRRMLTATGFAVSAAALLVFAHLGPVAGAPLLGLAIYGVYTLAISYGPGTVSGGGLLGVELAPTRVRSIAQAITVVGGRIGASVAAFLFPVLLESWSVSTLLVILAIVSLIGAFAAFLVPETAGRSLEEINVDSDAAIAAAMGDLPAA